MTKTEFIKEYIEWIPMGMREEFKEDLTTAIAEQGKSEKPTDHKTAGEIYDTLCQNIDTIDRREIVIAAMKAYAAQPEKVCELVRSEKRDDYFHFKCNPLWDLDEGDVKEFNNCPFCTGKIKRI